MIYPDERFASPADALVEAFTRLARFGEDAWVTVTVTGHTRPSGEPLVIEGKAGQLNTLLDELPVDLATRIGARRIETALYDIPGADAIAMAFAVDTVIRAHYGVPNGYAFEAQIQD